MLRCQEITQQEISYQEITQQKPNQPKLNDQTSTQADQPNQSSQFQYVREWRDAFLNLFPHREDYLWAEHPIAGTRPQWQTESSHPLSDRQIQQGNYLFGVRFGALTQYLMLDIDPTSVYHPSHDPLAIDHLMAALEPLGLVTYVAVQSSTRGGIHLYLPFQEAQKSWAIARAAAFLLTHQGFTLSPGQLELFPNPKPYSNTPTLYNGHRLPLQSGSYLLNVEWNCIYSTQAEFSQRWNFAQTRNDLSQRGVEAILNQSQRRGYRNLRTGGQKYLNDLNADIEPGWTGPGQTNFLLGKIANRERVFHHILWGSEPLEIADLAETIAHVARSLPGFQEFCQHQADLDQKASEWAKAATQRYYPYPYGTIPSPSQPQKPEQLEPTATPLSWNQKQSEAARQRITDAIVDLLNQNTLPAQATARRHAIRTYGVGNKTLDKNRDLWHPDFITSIQPDLKSLDSTSLADSNLVASSSSVSASEHSASEQYHPACEDLPLQQSPESLAEAEYHPIHPNKLEGLVASNVPQEQFEGNPSVYVGGSGGFSTDQSNQEKEKKGVEWVKLALAQIEFRRKQKQESEQVESCNNAQTFTTAQNAGATNTRTNTATPLSISPAQSNPEWPKPIASSITEPILTPDLLKDAKSWRSTTSITDQTSNPYLHPS